VILAALADYHAARVGTADGPPPHGYAAMGVVGALSIHDDGRLSGLLDLRVPRERPNRAGKVMGADLVPPNLVVPQVPKRASNIAPGFLCDTAAYLLGHFGKDDPAGRAKGTKRAAEQFAATRRRHEAILQAVDDPAAQAVLAHFRSWDPAAATALFADVDPALATGWLVIRLVDRDGRYAHDVPALRQSWTDALAADTDGPRGQCLLTGAPDQPIALVHPAIKGVPGAQSSGAALVSFNLSAFKSYNRDQNANAPISAPAAFAYTTALNHLLRRDSPAKVQLGETTVVTWAEVPNAAETTLAAYFGKPPPAGADRKVRDQLARIARGSWAEDPDLGAHQATRFYVLGLAPNAARLQIRFFLTDTLETFLQRIHRHGRDLLLANDGPGADSEHAADAAEAGEREEGEAGTGDAASDADDVAAAPRMPSFYRIALATLPYDAATKRARLDEAGWKRLNRLSDDLVRAVLGDLPYPQALLPLVLDRLRTDRHCSALRVGILKAAVNRYRRANPALGQQEIAMGLDPENRETGYLIGRLFAVLENIQRNSQDSPSNLTIYDRYAAAASVNPGTVMPTVLQLSDSHMKRLRRKNAGFAVNRGRRQSEIFDLIAAESGFPDRLDTHQQGLFYIGYHQQRTALWAKRDPAEPAAAEAGNEADPSADTSDNQD